MARHKKKHNGTSPERKMAKKAIGYVKVLVGVIGFGHGAIRAGVETAQDGQWALFGDRTIKYYTGAPVASNPNFEQGYLINSLITIGATVGILKLLSWGQKHM